MARESEDARVRPIYVCGAMRSGTTLLQRLVCLSPDANILASAARYLTEQIRIYAKFAKRDSLYIEDHIGDSEAFKAFTQDLVDRVLRRAWSLAGEPSALVLKSAELSMFVPETQNVLGTKARFLFSVREPKDTIASSLRVGERQREAGVVTALSKAGRNIDGLCDLYNAAYLPLLSTVSNPDSPLRSRVFFARYEDLTKTPDLLLDQICGFCEIAPAAIPTDGPWPASDSMAKLAEHPMWRTFMTELSGQGVSGASVGRHKAVLTPEECERVDDKCRVVAEFFKYR